jgi:hypothetical protein
MKGTKQVAGKVLTHPTQHRKVLQQQQQQLSLLSQASRGRQHRKVLHVGKNWYKLQFCF